jgi:hypothetical protein
MHISEEWEQLGGFPGVIGAIYGTHIDLVRCPPYQGKGFVDRNKNYSIQAQCVVNHRVFLRMSTLDGPAVPTMLKFRSVQIQSIYRGNDQSSEQLHPLEHWYVLGDSAYPLST